MPENFDQNLYHSECPRNMAIISLQSSLQTLCIGNPHFIRKESPTSSGIS